MLEATHKAIWNGGQELAGSEGPGKRDVNLIIDPFPMSVS